MTALLLRSMFMVFVAGIIGSFGSVFMKLAAGRITSNPLSFVNSRLILGVVLYLASTVIYLSALKGGQLSVLYPMVALGYIWTLLWAKIFFQENMSGAKFAGLGLIIVGVALVGIGIGQ